MSISKNIKLLRKQYKLSQKDLALIAGVSDKAVSTWERGLKDPRMGAIQKIADHFGIKKSNLIEDDGMNTILLPSATTNNENTPSEKKKFNFYATESEQNLVKKYRCLPPSGKATVDAVLDVQYDIVSPKV